MDETIEIERLRQQIKRMLSRVPSSVNAGSYDKSIAFKKTAAAAAKEADKSRPSLAGIRSAHNSLAIYY